MSREETAKNKIIRQQSAPDGPSHGKKRGGGKKPWKIEQRFVGAPEGSIFNELFSKDGKWHTYRRYKKESGAREAFSQIKNDSWHEYFEFKVVPPK